MFKWLVSLLMGDKMQSKNNKLPKDGIDKLLNMVGDLSKAIRNAGNEKTPPIEIVTAAVILLKDSGADLDNPQHIEALKAGIAVVEETASELKSEKLDEDVEPKKGKTFYIDNPSKMVH